MRKRLGRGLVISCMLLAIVAMMALPTMALAKSHTKVVGAVYVQTNEIANMIAVFNRMSDGTLMWTGNVATGGMGTGAGLGSQGALALSHDGKWLFAVNAGSNDVSVFRVGKTGITWTDQASSTGTMPVSVTVHGGLVYVLNDGGSGSICGFMASNGHLTPIPGSTQMLSNLGVGASPVAEQIGFNPKGNVLVVTEKSTGMIDTYAVMGGVAQPPMVNVSNGAGPYGFDFTKKGKLVVSEAAIAALSSYKVTPVSFNTISASVPDGQLAPCWVVVSPKGKYVYTADAHSNDISIYKVKSNGMLTLGTAAAVTVGTPLDLAMPRSGKFLYNLALDGSRNVAAFKVGKHGSLMDRGSFGNLPTSSAGLVAW